MEERLPALYEKWLKKRREFEGAWCRVISALVKVDAEFLRVVEAQWFFEGFSEV